MSDETREERVNVLLVDDQEGNLLVLEEMLRPLGQNLVKARSGREALAQLLRKDFALIILDVVMPEMDGFETAKIVRERDRSKLTPIIFLTAGDRTEKEIFRGYEVGAVDYINKPIAEEVLRSKASVFIELAKTAALVKKQADALERKNVELERARERAERESQIKSKFLASMSHELRTPLNAIIGFSELMEQEIVGPLSAKQKEYVGTVVRSGKHLLGLVNDLLDLSKVQAGRMELQREWTTLEALAASVRNVVLPLAEKQGVALDVLVPDGLPRLHVDPLRIKEVLLNLLSNAIKFTPEGGKVTLTGRAVDGRLEIAIKDTGVGIRREDMPRLFREFEHISPLPGALQSRPEGTGLGLVISQRLVLLHGGTIAVESVPREGTTVTVVLPLPPARNGDSPGEPAELAPSSVDRESER